MNLVFGEVLEVFREDGMRMGKIRGGGAAKIAALDLIHDAARGDRVLLCDGVAIGKVENENNRETNYVPRHSR
jgi:hydrogenase maturation factor